MIQTIETFAYRLIPCLFQHGNAVCAVAVVKTSGDDSFKIADAVGEFHDAPPCCDDTEYWQVCVQSG